MFFKNALGSERNNKGERAVTQSMSNLDRLVERAGVAPFFYDIWGNRREASIKVKQGLLAAMGLPAKDEIQAGVSLADFEEKLWKRLAPPVLTVQEREPVTVLLTLDAALQGATIDWVVREESGALHQGRALVGRLPLTGERKSLEGDRKRCALILPTRLSCGYHQLFIEILDNDQVVSKAVTCLIIAPERCLSVQDVAEVSRAWGLAVQLYGLRSGGNWGVGDFSDLGRFGEVAGRLGAATVGLNPLHALFSADSNHFSPYSPSSRVYLNTIYIDVVAVPELTDSSEAQAMIGSPDFLRRLAQARDVDLVDYSAVAALKRPVLELLHQAFLRLHGDGKSSRGQAFQAFQQEQGAELRRFALFEALHEHFYGVDSWKWSWTDWPAPYQNPDSPETCAFEAEHEARVVFFEYLQWLADEQLRQASERARAAGLRMGFYRDLAVGGNPGGADAWMRQSVVAAGARVGAPPDEFNLNGQNWGLAPLSPSALTDSAYESFIRMVRANMRHAGVLRIDHVMALRHLYWIPVGMSEGSYVRYPFEDLLRIIALESHRNRCVVVGEDLGTVPEGFRPAMKAAGVLSYKVMYFERDHHGNFLSPSAYPEESLITVTTHDLPTLRGFWDARDLDWRDRLGLYPEPGLRDRDRHNRHADRYRLMSALAEAGVFEWRDTPPDYSASFACVVHRWLSQATGALMMAAVEDAVGEAEQPNLPGTVDQHPNWRRRLPVTIEQISSSERVAALAEALRDRSCVLQRRDP
ncbi:4-alpha-glucanotransferase [Azospirillaceae bacterium]